MEKLKANQAFPKLNWAYETNENTGENIYYGLQFEQGGDLHKVQSKVSFLELKFRIKEMIDAKTSFLLTTKGHVKIIDFGLSESVYPGEAIQSYMGTPGYVSKTQEKTKIPFSK